MYVPSAIDWFLRKAAAYARRKKPLPTTPEIEDHVFLFLGGLHRSGTSILHRLLREHPSASGFTGTAVYEDEGQHLQTVFPPAKVYGGPGRFAFDPRSHLTETSDLITASNKEHLLREWGAYYNLERRVLLEKSPPNLVRSRFFQALFPGSRFVFIVRHPIVVSLATQKWSGNSVVELILHWYVANRILFDDFKRLQHSLIFRYEDFVQAPQSYLDAICNLVGIDSFKPQESVANFNGKYLLAWFPRYERERELLIHLYPEVVAFLSQLGYTLTEPYVTNLADKRFLADTRSAKQ